MDRTLLATSPTTVQQQIGDAQVAWRYTDYEVEYTALRQQAALFDHSGVGLIRLRGDALGLLQQILARDVEFLTPDRCLTSLLLDEDGTALDIVTVYLFDEYALLETSVGSSSATLELLRARAGDDVTVADLSDSLRLIGIEGPYAWGVVGKVLSAAVTALPYESVAQVEWNGQPMHFARSGFTAEYGYKVMVSDSVAPALWAALAEHAQPVGQQVIETAMLEVRQPVLRLEATTTGVVESGMAWLVDVTKPDFQGRDAIVASLSRTPEWATIGVSTDGVSQIRPGDRLEVDGLDVGTVTCAADSPGLGGTLALALVATDFAAADLDLDVVTSAGPQRARTLASPYVIPGSWSTPIL